MYVCVHPPADTRTHMTAHRCTPNWMCSTHQTHFFTWLLSFHALLSQCIDTLTPANLIKARYQYYDVQTVTLSGLQYINIRCSSFYNYKKHFCMLESEKLLAFWWLASVFLNWLQLVALMAVDLLVRTSGTHHASHNTHICLWPYGYICIWEPTY